MPNFSSPSRRAANRGVIARSASNSSGSAGGASGNGSSGGSVGGHGHHLSDPLKLSRGNSSSPSLGASGGGSSMGGAGSNVGSGASSFDSRKLHQPSSSFMLRSEGAPEGRHGSFTIGMETKIVPTISGDFPTMLLLSCSQDALYRSAGAGV